jgi:retron-type reverse transcriptase
MLTPTWFDRLTSFPNLLLAAQRAQRGKRVRPNVAAFWLNREQELVRLQEGLRTRTYRPGPYRTFILHEKKPRLISAAPFRDRVVHHALCNIIEPIFERGFLFDSYACRKGKGTHAAVERASAYARRFRYVLKCDIEKYFPSIDHDILFAQVARRIHDEGVCWLVRTIIDGSNPQPDVVRYHPGDDLFTPFERRRGIPIGNQTSQFFANVYLDGLDHYVKETLRVPGYVRYVDDFLLFANEKTRLHTAKAAIEDRCVALRLRLHPRKSFVAPVRDGCTFLGYRLFPTCRRLDAENVRRFRRRLRSYDAAVASGLLPMARAREGLRSWIAHASHADTCVLRRRLLMNVAWIQSPGCAGSVSEGAPWRVLEQ